jgi:hypothetical protein
MRRHRAPSRRRAAAHALLLPPPIHCSRRRLRQPQGIIRGSERLDQFRLAMSWNQEELEQWAAAEKAKEEDSRAVDDYRWALHQRRGAALPRLRTSLRPRPGACMRPKPRARAAAGAAAVTAPRAVVGRGSRAGRPAACSPSESLRRPRGSRVQAAGRGQDEGAGAGRREADAGGGRQEGRLGGRGEGGGGGGWQTPRPRLCWPPCRRRPVPVCGGQAAWHSMRGSCALRRQAGAQGPGVDLFVDRQPPQGAGAIGRAGIVWQSMGWGSEQAA